MPTMLPEWAAHPARGTMVIMLLFGATFAIGHHFFYQSLSGKPPPSAVYFTSFAGGLTGQQVNLAAGSVFAFLVNSALGVAITTAVDQALWTTVRTKSSTPEVIDDLAAATTGIWSFFKFRLWKKSPISMGLAIIFWLLSITSFITPATLNIEWSAEIAASKTKVPQVDFTSLNFADFLEMQGGDGAGYAYSNPQYSVLQTVAESTTGGRILPISPPYQNATWLLEFPGPALSCGNLDKESALYNNITNNILTAMASGSLFYPGDQEGFCTRSYGFISWVPTFLGGLAEATSELPFPGVSLTNTTYEPPSQGVGPFGEDNEILTLYIAALPGMIQENTTTNRFCTEPKDDSISFSQFAFNQVANMTITRCLLQNTTYVANFTYINNIQSINVTTKGPSYDVRPVSALFGEHPLQSQENSSSPWVDNVFAVQVMAFEAVMDAFGRMFVGTIAYDFTQKMKIVDTQMASTPLLATKDFNFLQPTAVKGETNLLQAAVGNDPTLWRGLSVEQAPNSTTPVANMTEELFRNVTISLMSNSLLRPNYSSPYAPPDPAVTQTTYALHYSYAAPTLWLAYGIALGMTLISIFFGIASIHFNNGSSYTTKFSTILRVAYYIALSEPIRPEDTDGKDPMPEYLKKIIISFPSTGTTVQYNRVAEVSEEEQLQQGENNRTEIKGWNDDQREVAQS